MEKLVPLAVQFGWLLMLAIPIACISWTVTHEEIFREPREYCIKCSKERRSILARKFFYVFTCEYCFSHYITLLFLFFTRYTMLFTGWIGYIISFFSLVWIANVYMSIFGLIRVGIKRERTEINYTEEKIEKKNI